MVHNPGAHQHKHLHNQPDTWQDTPIDPDYEEYTPEELANERKGWEEILGHTIEDCKLEGCTADATDNKNGYCTSSHWGEGTDGRFD